MLTEEKLSTLRYHLLKAEELSARLSDPEFDSPEPVNWTVIGIVAVISTTLFILVLFGLEHLVSR